MKKFLIAGIFLLAFILRFYKLGFNPPAIYWDETINCYDAYSLGQTGKDHHGNPWPIAYLTSYYDYKNPLYTYLDIIPVKIFGLNEFSCRFPSAFFGWLTVILSYFLVKELWKVSLFFHQQIGSAKDRKKGAEFIAIITTLLLAVSPWHLQFSRAGFEANINLFFVVLGVYLFLKAIGDKPFFLILSAISFSLTPYAYHSSKLFMPLLVIFLSILNSKFILRNLKWAVISLIIGLMIIYPLTTKEARKAVTFRFTETNIFNESDVVLKSNKLREEDNWNFLSNIFHNRRIFYLQNFLIHYFDHFNFKYLFLTGDSNLRHNTQAVGELYLIEFPFLPLGFYFFLKNKEKALIIPLGWLLLSIIPASFTVSTPHAIRSLSSLPTWQIFTAYGVFNSFSAIRKEKLKKFLFIICNLLFGISVFYYLHYYYVHYPKESFKDWQYGYKEAISYIRENYDKYEKIVISDFYGRAYGYLLFYLKYPPAKIQEEAKVIEKEKRGIYRVGKCEVSNITQLLNSGQKNILLIASPEEFSKNIKAKKVIYGLDKKPVFKIVSF